MRLNFTTRIAKKPNKHKFKNKKQYQQQKQSGEIWGTYLSGVCLAYIRLWIRSPGGQKETASIFKSLKCLGQSKIPKHFPPISSILYYKQGSQGVCPFNLYLGAADLHKAVAVPRQA